MDILQTISYIIMGIMVLYCGWVMFFVLSGIFIKGHSWEDTDKTLRFACIICARNEEAVIANLIESLKKQNYPKNAYDIFTVAHNCTDRTAEMAREAGAAVFILDDSAHPVKAAALREGLIRIQTEAEIPYDAFAVFDADNLVDPDYLTEINKALCSGGEIAQGFRAIKNYNDNLLTKLFGGLWMGMTYAQYIPHNFFRLPVTLCGTGFAAKFSVLPEEGWHTETLCEDIEFTCQQVIAGHRIVLAANARFYDEQTRYIKDGLHQRFRWAVGINQCFCRYFFPLVKKIPKRGFQAVKTALDLCLNPICILGFFCCLFQMIYMINRGTSLMTLLTLSGIAACLGWLCVLPISINLIVKEKMLFRQNIDMILFLPLFLCLSGVMALAAPFCMNSVRWKPIAHTSVRSIDEVE